MIHERHHWAACTGPRVTGGAGTRLPPQRHSKVVQLSRKQHLPPKVLSLGILGYSVRKFWRHISGPHLWAVWTTGATEVCCNYELQEAIRRPLKCNHIHCITSIWGKFHISPVNNSHTKRSIHLGLVSTLWARSRYIWIATASTALKEHVSPNKIITQWECEIAGASQLFGKANISFVNLQCWLWHGACKPGSKTSTEQHYVCGKHRKHGHSRQLAQ